MTARDQSDREDVHYARRAEDREARARDRQQEDADRQYAHARRRRVGRPRLPIDEEAITSAYAAGESLEGIARRLGIDRGRVTRTVEEAGLRPGSPGRNMATVGSVLPEREERDWVLSAELLGEAGITYRQLDYWCRTGLLQPIGDANPGQGWSRRFPEEQVVRARTIVSLLDAGLSMTKVREVVDDFLANGRVDLGGFTLTREPS